MPWKVTGVMEERMKLVVDWERGEYTKAELCQIYGVSRPTADKWLDRYARSGVEGLRDQSRAPRHHPNQTPPGIEEAIVGFRQQHLRRGPKKIRAILQRRHPKISWPAASTIGDILERHRLVEPRKLRRRAQPYTEPFVACDRPNSVWCIDFKGWFRTGDGCRCDPLTISDAYSRYLLQVRLVERCDSAHVRKWMEVTFRRYGLPWAIRSDNGPPFASTGLCALSRLSVWWIKLGIRPERIAPGKPQQNGRHERMHLTLKQEAATPPKSTGRAQQRAFQRFLWEYNHERPHEALGQRCPASVYRPSARRYPRRLAKVEYPSTMQVRQVRARGQFSWRDQDVFLSEALRGERIGLAPIDGRYWRVYFGWMELCVLDEAGPVLRPLTWARKRMDDA